MNDIYRLTPIHHWHAENGARFVIEDGWKRVESYGNAEDEVGSVSTRVGICDVTPLTKIDLQGKSLNSVLASCLESGPIPDVGFWARGNVHANDGRAVVRVARLRADRFLILGPEAERQALFNRFRDLAPAEECAHVTDMTSAFAAFRLSGPESAQVLKRICPINLDGRSFASGQCAQASLARVGAVILRDDIGTLPNYLILVSRDYGEYVWEGVVHVGEKYGMRCYGLSAARRLDQGIGNVAAIQH
jgi:heterotetrameric sarcosine oxidase gamma subunit